MDVTRELDKIKAKSRLRKIVLSAIWQHINAELARDSSKEEFSRLADLVEEALRD